MIAARREQASIVYDDDQVVAFMDIRPIRRGQLVVIPRQHVDEFADLPDALATEVLLVGQRLARVLRRLVAPKRVGIIIHGFGVAHAHLVLIPLEHPSDITAAQFAEIADGRIVFRWEAVPLADRADLDEFASSLREAAKSDADTSLKASDGRDPSGHAPRVRGGAGAG